MASKSKKRRRVFRASCILAALIIAGSSFAWFTSSDEVTNRLSAQADYGVSIVESFAPPKMWLPGQEVNKDVYATNTGNIAALVKEEIDTRIAITYEVDQAEWDPDCVELTEEERYAMEAGSFLAYRPSDSAYPVSGYEIVTRPADNEDNHPAEPDFTPDKKGLYVFRRSIDVINADTGEESFKYDGYYFVPKNTVIGKDGENDIKSTEDKYYKISHLQDYADSHVAEKTGEGNSVTWTFKDYMGDGVNDDGTLMVAGAAFRKEVKDIVDPMDLSYLKLSETEVKNSDSKYYGMDAGQYLVATYKKGNNKATADAAAKAEALDRANHELEYAQALLEQAQEEYTAAHDTELENANKQLNGDSVNPAATPGATKELENATANYEHALGLYNNAVTDYKNKRDALDDAKRTYENSMKKLYGSTTGGTGENEFTADSLYGKYNAAMTARDAAGLAANAAYAAGSGINTEFTNYKDNATPAFNDDWKDAHSTVADLTTTELKAFRDWIDKNVTNEEHDHYQLIIDELIAKYNYETERDKCLGTTGTDYDDAANGTYGATYKTALTNYKAAYNALGDIDYKTEYNGYRDGVVIQADDSHSADFGLAADLNNAKTTLEGAQTAYETAVENYQKALKKSNAAKELQDAAEALKEAANKAQTAAQSAYDTAKGKLGDLDGNDVNIYIKLNDDAVITDQTDEKNKGECWWLDPVTLDPAAWTEDTTNIQTGTLLNNKASFYYTGLLEGGETSTKLVDYVYLDKNLKANDYKDFDFDINVSMNSAQINLDDKGNIKTDAAQAEIGKFATYNGGLEMNDLNKVVKWSDSVDAPAAAPQTKFVSGGTEVGTPVAFSSAEDALKNYKWKIVLSAEQATAIGGTAAEGNYVCETQTGTYKKLNTNEDGFADPEVSIPVTATTA